MVPQAEETATDDNVGPPNRSNSAAFTHHEVSLVLKESGVQDLHWYEKVV